MSAGRMGRPWAALLVFGLLTAACATGGAPATTAPPATTAAPGTTAAPATTAAPTELVDATLRLDWSWLVYHSPFVYAKEQGYFEDEGINLEILEGQGSGGTVTLVGTGDDEFGFADSGTMMLQRSQGVPVKNVWVLQRQSGFGTACFESVGFQDPKDLEGRSVLLVPQESTAQIWPAYLEFNGVDPNQVTVVNTDFANKVKLLADGQADCMAGYVAQDTLQAQLINPDIADPIPWTEHGIQLMGHGIVVHEETIANSPELVEGFVRASVRGWQEVCENPQLGIDLFLEMFPDLSDADVEFTNASMPFECAQKLDPGPGDSGQRLGPTDDSQWQAMLDVLTQFGGLTNPLPPGDYYTNEFVPQS